MGGLGAWEPLEILGALGLLRSPWKPWIAKALALALDIMGAWHPLRSPGEPLVALGPWDAFALACALAFTLAHIRGVPGGCWQAQCQNGTLTRGHPLLFLGHKWVHAAKGCVQTWKAHKDSMTKLAQAGKDSMLPSPL